MASFGKVLDLLDERYLNLQDVVGNVEPLPSLVPYEDYTENVLVYRMDKDHDIFLGLLHEFTAEKSQDMSQELWTWFVQWQVDKNSVRAPTSKKIRLDDAALNTHPKDDEKEESDPIIDIFERCVLDLKLFEEDEMLRCLVDIVQVESSIVPNYIEFLYRWVDFYAGDGKALKAALKWEIPSLWDFEHHPFLLPEELKKANERHKLMEAEERKLMLAGAGRGTHNGKAAMSNDTEEFVEASHKKEMRKKPDLAAMERKTEESERLQYREVKYGIQPPKLDTPMPPLINIPRHPIKRQKYYAACYRSRQRAIVILLEAGLTLKQIGNYRRLQIEDIRDTPTEGVPDDTRKMHGMRNFHKDADAAQKLVNEKEKLRSPAEKQTEIAMSEQLALDARRATQSSAAAGRSGAPLIPPTPAYPPRADMAADMLARIKALRGQGEERINFVPTPLVGLMKARLFEDAKDSRLMKNPNNAGQNQVHPPQGLVPREDEGMNSSSDEETGSESESESGSDSGSDSDESSDDDDDETPEESPASAFLPSQALGDPFTGGASPGFGPPQMTSMVNSSGMGSAAYANMPGTASQPRSAFLPAPPAPGLTTPGGIRPTLPRTPPASQTSGYAMPSISGGFRQAPAQLRNPQTQSVPFATAQHHSAPQFTLPFHQQNQQPAQGFGFLSGPPQITRTTHIIQPSVPPPRLPPLPLRASTQNQTSPSSTSPFLPTMQGSHATVLPPPMPSGSGSCTPATGQRPSTSFENFLTMQRQRAAQAQGQAVASPMSSTAQNVVALHNSRPPTAQGQMPTSQAHQEGSITNLPRPSSQPFAPLPLPRPAPPSITITAPPQPGLLPASPLSSISTISRPSLPTQSRTLQRPTAPSPLTLAPPQPSSPLTSLAPSLLCTTPFLTSHTRIPILIYFPRIVIPSLPRSFPFGENSCTATDAIMLGYTSDERGDKEGKIELTKALLLPTSIFPNLLAKVRSSGWKVLETYMSPAQPCLFSLRQSRSHTHSQSSSLSQPQQKFAKNTIPQSTSSTPHFAAYTKLTTAFSLLLTSAPSPRSREQNLTKRWRASRGPMKWRERGAVWEGWGLTIDEEVRMSSGEREGALVFGRGDGEGMDEEELEEGWEE